MEINEKSIEINENQKINRNQRNLWKCMEINKNQRKYYEN